MEASDLDSRYSYAYDDVARTATPARAAHSLFDAIQSLADHSLRTERAATKTTQTACTGRR